MSFCIVNGIDLGNKSKYQRYGDFFVKYNNDSKNKKTIKPLMVKKNQNGIVLCNGEFFSELTDEFLESNWNSLSDTTFSEIIGAFSLIKIDTLKNEISFITSRVTCEPLFRYHKDGVLILSDNFWEVINLIEPNIEQINIQALYETLMHYYPMFDETIIKDLYCTLPSTYGTYSSKNNGLQIKKYWEVSYKTKKDTNIHDAIDSLDNILYDAVKKIKNVCGDVQYSVGLSGGLDSRIIPYYAKRNNLKIKSFIIGNKKPYKILLSKDHKSARELSKYYGISHEEYEYNLNPLEKQFLLDITQFPTGASQLFKIPPIDNLDFDVLFTGGNGGVLVGASVPKGIQSMDTEELLEAINDHIKIVNSDYYFRSRFSQILKYLFNIEYNPSKRKLHWINKINPKEHQNVLDDKFRCFIEEKKKRGLDNLSIYQDYNTQLIGFRSRMGSFEGMLGLSRAFSIWAPFIIDEAMKWPNNFVESRVVLKELIKSKMPEVARIRTQTYKNELYISKTPKISKLISIIDFLLRGAGTVRMDRWVKKKDFKVLFDNHMKNHNKWFYKILELDKDELDSICKDQHRLSLTMLKLKGVIDVIETKKYKEFI